MFESINLNCGPTRDSDVITLDGAPGMTVFVGPNNSGKSALLHEIHQRSTKSQYAERKSSLHSIRFTPFEPKILEFLPEFGEDDDDRKIQLSGTDMPRSWWIETFHNDTNWQSGTGRHFRSALFAWLDGGSRLRMLADEQNPSLTRPETPLARLFKDDHRRREFQSAVFKGIGHYPIIDRVSTHGHLKLAFSTTLPGLDIERGADQRLLDFLESCISRHSASDGFNAYVGIIGTLFATNYRCILIDEPEAFLHPTLARTLGHQLATYARDRHVFVATHSSEFVMGSIEAGAPVRIVRLQFQADEATACLLDGQGLRDAMADPLLRSSNVLSGLFSKAAIVTEGDTDRAFYQEINARLISAGDLRAIDNAVFLNANGKHALPRIIKLLRRMAIPTVGIVDLDVVCDGGHNWKKQLIAAAVPEGQHKAVDELRKELRDRLKAISTDPEKTDFKRKGGVSLLGADDKDTANRLLEILARYGLFVVPIGEVEGWLQGLDVPRAKHSWLHSIFEKLGNAPDAESYVRPTSGDVWDFIGSIQTWLANPARRGL